MNFDHKYWKGILEVIDETFDTASVGMKDSMRNALIEMRSKLQSRNLHKSTNCTSLHSSDKMQNAEKKKVVRLERRRGDDS